MLGIVYSNISSHKENKTPRARVSNGLSGRTFGSKHYFADDPNNSMITLFFIVIIFIVFLVKIESVLL